MKKRSYAQTNKLWLVALIIPLVCFVTQAQTTVFTYQGRLTDGGTQANGNYDLQFALFDNVAGPTQIGSTLTRNNVGVSGGVFTVQLDFAVSVFPGADRFLEIGVKPAGGPSFTILSPRQQINSSPYAIRTISAAQADGLSSACVNCVQDAQINSVAGSKITGLLPTTSLPPNSGSYVQNTISQQAGTSFNISGNGIVGGNLGVGTESPAFKLDVLGSLRASRSLSNDIVVQTTGGTNSWARFGMRTPNQSWVLGTSQSFNGDQFYLFDETAGQTRMTIQPNNGAITFPTGNVGIGTLNPQTKLQVQGSGVLESTISSTDERAILSLNSTISGANRVWTLENGLFGTQGLFGIYDRTAGQGRLTIDTAGTVGVTGNAVQSFDKGGWAKALLFVDGGGTILRCYNGVTGNSSSGCGFIVTHTLPGVYGINLGFPTDGRFVLASSIGEQGINGSAQVTRGIGTGIGVQTFVTGETIDWADRSFMVVVF